MVLKGSKRGLLVIVGKLSLLSSFKYKQKIKFSQATPHSITSFKITDTIEGAA